MPETLSGFIGSEIGQGLLILSITFPVLSLTLPGLIYILNTFQYGFFIFAGRKAKQYGLVYDEVNKKPIPYAVVRVFDKQNNQVAMSVTDLDGKYKQDVGRGEYTFEVKHPNYDVITKEVNIESENGSNEDFALMGRGALLEPKLRIDLKKVLGIITILAFIYSLLCLLVNTQLLNILIVDVYIATFVAQWLIARMSSKGIVVDGDSGKSVSGVFVRVFSKAQGRQLEASITNANGNVNFNVPDGQYQISVYKEGYGVDKKQSSIVSGGTELIDAVIKDGRLNSNILVTALK
jgi:hypothetical protein